MASNTEFEKYKRLRTFFDYGRKTLAQFSDTSLKPRQRAVEDLCGILCFGLRFGCASDCSVCRRYSISLIVHFRFLSMVGLFEAEFGVDFSLPNVGLLNILVD